MENLPDKPRNKGGRPLGKVSLLRKLQLKEENVLKTRIYKNTKRIVDAQIILATGSHKMITIEKDPDGSTHVTTIRDDKKMTDLLDNGIYGQDYFIVIGKEPDGDIGNKLLDRGYGKARENINLDVDVKFSILDLAKRAEQLEAEDKKKPIDVSYQEIEQPL